MNKDKITQFICFETTLNTNQFMMQWNQYNKSSNSETDITLQQNEKNGVFKYVTQHRFENDETQFMFTKPKKSSRVPEVSVKEKQAGGYSIIQTERKDDIHDGESKIFVFFADSIYDFSEFKELCSKAKLNIYEAYYQNSKYSAILEIFVKNKDAANLVTALKQHTNAEIGIYEACELATA
jgi:hypothetical protein